MTALRHAVTGHEIEADGDSIDFWKAAGYREAGEESTAKKAPAKKAASSKSGKK